MPDLAPKKKNTSNVPEFSNSHLSQICQIVIFFNNHWSNTEYTCMCHEQRNQARHLASHSRNVRKQFWSTDRKRGHQLLVASLTISWPKLKLLERNQKCIHVHVHLIKHGLICTKVYHIQLHNHYWVHSSTCIILLLLLSCSYWQYIIFPVYPQTHVYMYINMYCSCNLIVLYMHCIICTLHLHDCTSHIPIRVT